MMPNPVYKKSSSGFALKKSVLAMSGLLLSTVGAVNVNAVETPTLEEVVVTGTLIRGIEPTGSQSIGVDNQAIIESGAVTANDILGTLPQASNLFNGNTALDPRAQSQNTITRPNLRNLPGFTTSTGAATLVMIDGHRTTGMGVVLSAVDPDILPPGVIERVEVITDGGSSLYGADAVGGVINFVTLKDFEGVKIDLNYGTGDDYSNYDTNITAGTSWGSGSAYVSMAYSDRDSILAGDRDWAPTGEWTASGLQPAGSECIEPVGGVTHYNWTSFGGGIYYNPQSVTTGDACDISAEGTLIPKEDRSSIYFGIAQDLNAGTSLTVKGFFSRRNTYFEQYPIGDSLNLGTAPTINTPNQGGSGPIDVVNVGFSYGAHPNFVNRDNTTKLEVYGITPELTIDLDSGWQLRTMLHFSHSDNANREFASNRALMLSAVEDGAFDPFDVAATDPALFDQLVNWENGGQSEQEIFIARMIADGAVAELPAGEVRAAIGVEFLTQSAQLRLGPTYRGAIDDEPWAEERRDVQAMFAEFNIPILDTLTMAASVRWDEYSDFGSTTNPHVGFTWEPLDWIKLHVNWGESFNAPTVIDTLQGQASIISVEPDTVGLVQGTADALGVVIESGRTDTIQIRGANPTLDPQTAETWALGFEIMPPVAEGLMINANYYEIDFEDILGFFNPTSAQSSLAFADKFTWNPTQADLDAFGLLGSNADEALAGVNPASIATLLDLRTANARAATLKGFDFGISYEHDTDLGTLRYTLSGNHQLEFELASRGGDPVDQLKFGQGDTSVLFSVSLDRGNLRAKVTAKHSVGFDVQDAAVVNGIPLQDEVDSFTVVDLFVGYDFQGSGFTDGLSVRFNVDNVFDEEPPRYRQNNVPSYSGFTLGRIFKFGVTKTF